MGSAVFESCRFADIHELFFQAAKRSDMDCVELQGVYLLIVRNGIFRSRNVQIIGVHSYKRVDLLMFTNSGFKVRNLEICAVLSFNKVDLLMRRNRVFRQRNDQKCAVLS